MSSVYTDPATGRRYTVDPQTGQSMWLDEPPAPPGFSVQSFPQPQSAPRRTHGLRNTLIVVAVGLSALVGIASALDGGKNDTTTTTQAAEPTPKKAGIGTPVRDGKFEFTVVSVKPGVKRIGDQYFGTSAQGAFMLVTVKVENIGNEPQMFDGSLQQAFDLKGRKLGVDTEAAIYMGDKAQSFLNNINPGNIVTGTVVFDVPAGVTLDHLELHDSMFSGGVEVSLH